MIHLRLIRSNPKDINQRYCVGELFYRTNETETWSDFCFTLEDKVRDINKDGKFDNGEKKIYGETAIPFGKYEGQVTFSNHFKREMPSIKNVPEFEGIRIHGGNDIDDTEGCILVAHNTDWKGKIWGSAEHELTNLIKEHDNNYNFTIEII